MRRSGVRGDIVREDMLKIIGIKAWSEEKCSG